MCSNFSAISAQLTRKGLRRRPEGELIDLGAALPLGERGTGQLHMKAQSRKKHAGERIGEKMVGNGREWLIDLGVAFGREGHCAAAHEGPEQKIHAGERIGEKMVGNGREWVIDLGQGPVRTERRGEKRLAGKIG